MLNSEESGDPSAELREIVVWAWDDLDGGNLSEVRGCCCGGVEAGFDGGDIAGEEAGDESGADFFPAGHLDVGGFECGVGGFKEGNEALGFKDADCLFGHNSYELKVICG